MQFPKWPAYIINGREIFQLRAVVRKVYGHTLPHYMNLAFERAAGLETEAARGWEGDVDGDDDGDGDNTFDCDDGKCGDDFEEGRIRTLVTYRN